MLQLYSICEWIAFICSCLLWAGGVKKEYRLFFFYSFFVVTVEYLGRWIAEVLKIPNHILYTIACFFFSCFYFYTVRLFLRDPKRQNAVVVSWLMFAVIYMVNILFFQRLSEFNSYSFIAGYVLVTIACSLYYTEFINRETIISLWKTPDFFIVSGYCLYAGLTAILYTIHHYFAYLKIPGSQYRIVFQQINTVANVSLYLLLATAFVIIWKRRRL